MRGCARIREAASRSGRLVSVAENYRRDPILRLARALLDADAIGEPRSIVELRAGGSDAMLITPWRHFREDGGPLMDVGVHYADMIVYLMGPVDRVAGITRLLEPVRTTDPRRRSAQRHVRPFPRGLAGHVRGHGARLAAGHAGVRLGRRRYLGTRALGPGRPAAI